MVNNLKIKKIDEIYPIGEKSPDDLFITCGSFEERFLGAPQRLIGDFPAKFILFKFTEPNEKREMLIKQMQHTLNIDKYKERYHQIGVEHGRSLEAILKFHELFNAGESFLKDLYITVDVSTFSKDLLLNFMFYLIEFLQTKIKRLRLLYTIPGRYASHQEGWLSFGIKSFHIPPMYWNAWSPSKDNLLIIILGFEEMRAWSLIDKISADLNWLFITAPGSKPEWDNYCEEYNKRLLEEMPSKGTLPALDPFKVSEVLLRKITPEINEKYNIFISPLGTKIQLMGVIYFFMVHHRIPVNIITTTVVEHNVPYYSWEIGETYEFIFPTNGEKNESQKI